MQTQLIPSIRDTTQGKQAYDIIRTCVHCGFCNATCPTYRLLGDELDGPRGRIYLIKQALEGNEVTTRTLNHLDRCLSCQACETTCPSGVNYTQLLDIGREFVSAKVSRSWKDRLIRKMLNTILPRRKIFNALYQLGRICRPFLPASIKKSIPKTQKTSAWPNVKHTQRVLLFDGCVQSSLAPHINLATAKVLDKLNISAKPAQGGGCCGALSYHLNETPSALRLIKANIDVWWQQLESGIKNVIVTASGCGVFIKQYARLMADDPIYAAKAERIANHTLDIAELLDQQDLSAFRAESKLKVAVHSPCTLQHGLHLQGVVDKILLAVGYQLTQVTNSHLCCGSAGTYSILQTKLSQQLLNDKLKDLQSDRPNVIATANIGCLLHIQKGANLPVKHWIELLAH